MVNNEKISIVVPIYNVEGYLDECIKSIVAQDYDNLEVILVNDGSTDASKDICDRYAQLYDYVIVCHQDNQGVSVARNKGIDLSTGNWIAFVDGDDQLCENALVNASRLLDDNIDCFVFNALREDKISKTSYAYDFSDSLKDKVISSSEVVCKHHYVRSVVWGNIYSRDFILRNNLRFIKGVINSQDTIFSLFAYNCDCKMYFSRVDFSFIKYRDNSASRSWSVDRVLRYIDNLKAIEAEVAKRGVDYKSSPIIKQLFYQMVSGLIFQAIRCGNKDVLRAVNRAVKQSALYPINMSGVSLFRTKIRILNLSVYLFAKLSQFKHIV